MTNDAERVSDIVARLHTDAAYCAERMSSTVNQVGRDCAEAADIIEAQSKALAEARVAMPLEWTKIDNANDDESEEAVTPFGGYVITADPFTYSPTTAYYVDGPDWFKAQCASVPEAKAAAQADYAARILSALTPTPENPNG